MDRWLLSNNKQGKSPPLPGHRPSDHELLRPMIRQPRSIRPIIQLVIAINPITLTACILIPSFMESTTFSNCILKISHVLKLLLHLMTQRVRIAQRNTLPNLPQSLQRTLLRRERRVSTSLRGDGGNGIDNLPIRVEGSLILLGPRQLSVLLVERVPDALAVVVEVDGFLAFDEPFLVAGFVDVWDGGWDAADNQANRAVL